MSLPTLRILIAVVLIAHGLGHALGMMSAAGLELTQFHSSKSWLRTGILGSKAGRVIEFLIFISALLGFAGGGLGLLGWQVPQEMWQQLTVVAAILSLVGLVLFPHAFPTLFPNVAGALAVDIAVLVCLLWLKWPPGLV
jgi:hypothetical protein